jgi:hypothetical protein
MSASTPPPAASSESTESSSAPEAQENAKTPDSRRKKTLGVAMGIGSAAIVAALLYANRSKRSGK